MSSRSRDSLLVKKFTLRGRTGNLGELTGFLGVEILICSQVCYIRSNASL